MTIEIPVENFVAGILALTALVFGGGAAVGIRKANNGSLKPSDLEAAVRKAMTPLADEMRRMREAQLELLTRIDERMKVVERDVGRVLNGVRE